ncbi:UDP-N-acetylmuramoyl-tripeptide--D-alanyl-D-alanine ligase [Pontibaca methylaminivorans]|uniref:UDP-N-acetylmuramoyl-tripeptide--D-alanyl-D- alanine ligase n=1 Tax=Pontibaca methylaminivorans TaxID=515897 RepID=UPI002FD91679
MSLWRADEAAAATGGRAQDGSTGCWRAGGVSIDTRTLVAGDLFVALSAARDGHDFVRQALAKGAAAALVSRVPEGIGPEAPLLIVEDVQAALEALGRAGRARSGAQAVGVTGSVGKTSTKEMLARILGDQGRVHASVASYNNHWGVPLTLARLPQDAQFAVIEIGMNHPGEIAPLAHQARPHVAFVTTIAPAHLEAFDGIEAIAREKAAIFEGLEPGGSAIINADIAQSTILRDHAQRCGAEVVDFGERAQDFRLLDVRMQDEALTVRAEARGEPLLFRIQSPGRHFALNGLGALAAALTLGCDPALAVQSLGRWAPVAGRGVRELVPLDAVDTGQVIALMDDSYNANPGSVAAALDTLAAATPPARGRRIAILGDMKELGPRGPELHAAIAGHPAIAGIDRVHCVGPLMRSLHEALAPERRGIRAENSAAMVAALKEQIAPGDLVLVKGSLSMNLAAVVDAIRKMRHGGTDPAPNHE